MPHAFGVRWTGLDRAMPSPKTAWRERVACLTEAAEAVYLSDSGT